MLQEKPSALKNQKNIGYIKSWNFFPFFYFCGSILWFLPSWIRIQPTRINADPDPKHCYSLVRMSLQRRVSCGLNLSSCLDSISPKRKLPKNPTQSDAQSTIFECLDQSHWAFSLSSGKVMTLLSKFFGSLTRERRLIPVCGRLRGFLLVLQFRRFSEVKTRDFSTNLFTHLRDSIFRLIRHFFPTFQQIDSAGSHLVLFEGGPLCRQLDLQLLLLELNEFPLLLEQLGAHLLRLVLHSGLHGLRLSLLLHRKALQSKWHCILIRGSVSLTNGSGSNSGSDSFLQWL